MSAARRGWVCAAALSGALVVALGAIAAHVLTLADPPRFELAWRIHVMHVMAMLIVALGLSPGFGVQAVLAGFLGGTLAFCGSLYWSALQPEASTALAPLGGSVLILSWLLLAVLALRRASYESSRSV